MSETAASGGRVGAGVIIAALFVPQMARGCYAGVGQAPPSALGVLAPIALTAGIWAWFWSYSQRNRVPWVMDMAWFLLLAWFIIVPYYILKVERRRGWGLMGIFCALWVAAWLTSIAVSVWTRLILGAE